MSMYEARQNKKETGGKVFRQIEVGGARQRVQDRKTNYNFQGENSKKNVNNIIVQKFAIPEGLPAMISDTANIMYRMSLVGGNLPLGGGTNWANETRSAANRKLDEYNLVEAIFKNFDNINNIGFGTNVKKQPDVISNGQTNVRGENKYVTGKISQVKKNIEEALGQLCDSDRSVGYIGTMLIARIKIDPNSEAAMALREIDEGARIKYLNSWVSIVNGRLYQQQSKQNNIYFILEIGDEQLISGQAPINTPQNASGIDFNEQELEDNVNQVKISQINQEEINQIDDLPSSD